MKKKPNIVPVGDDILFEAWSLSGNIFDEIY
jgi:hypothetical protein